MNMLACNYAIIRFLPYRETGEFVNLGIVLCCPKTGYFGYRLIDARRHKRVSDFFPEIDKNQYRQGISTLTKELSEKAHAFLGNNAHQLVFNDNVNVAHVFASLISLRETIFQFSEVRTLLAQDPKTKLEELYKHYVERLFAQPRLFQETIMRDHLAETLKQLKVLSKYKKNAIVGNDVFHVRMPFVQQVTTPSMTTFIKKAIRPLHLAKENSSDIYSHGDSVAATISRLNAMNLLPSVCIIPVKYPAPGTVLHSAAEDIRKQLIEVGATVVPFEDDLSFRNLILAN
jgi:hypothetical protein